MLFHNFTNKPNVSVMHYHFNFICCQILLCPNLRRYIYRSVKYAEVANLVFYIAGCVVLVTMIIQCFYLCGEYHQPN